MRNKKQHLPQPRESVLVSAGISVGKCQSSSEFWAQLDFSLCTLSRGDISHSKSFNSYFCLSDPHTPHTSLLTSFLSYRSLYLTIHQTDHQHVLQTAQSQILSFSHTLFLLLESQYYSDATVCRNK